MEKLFFGIDIGTGSTKGIVTDAKGVVYASASHPHETETPHPGWFEHDPETLWWGEVVSISRNLTQQIKDQGMSVKDAAAGLCVSTIAPCVLPVDRQGRPLRKGILYGIDTRASKEIEEIEQRVGRQEIFSMTGQHLSSQSCCPKIRWIEKHEPEVWKHTHKILTASGYIVYKLTGRYTVDMYDAIGYAPVFHISQQRWDDTHAEGVIDMDLLPEILWSHEVAGCIGRQAAEETGLPEGLPVMTGTADAAAESLSAGVAQVGDMMMMFGSSNFFISRTSSLRPVDSFWASNFLTPGTTVLTGGMATVGSLFNWLNEIIPGKTYQEWERLAAASGAGARGLTVLPYFAGERTPLFNPDAKGVFFGLSLQTNHGDIFQAVQEAVGFGIRHNLEVMEDQGEQAKRIVAIGGVASSDMTMQVITDIIGIPLQRPKQQWGARLGDAFLAALGTGYVKSEQDITGWVDLEREFIPNRELHERYSRCYSTYRELYESTKHLM